MSRLELSLCTLAVAVICLPLVLVREKPEPWPEAVAVFDGSTLTNAPRTGLFIGEAYVATNPVTKNPVPFTNVHTLEQELMVELGAEEGARLYRHVVDLSSALRATNRGVFPGARVGMPTNQIPEEP